MDYFVLSLVLIPILTAVSAYTTFTASFEKSPTVGISLSSTWSRRTSATSERPDTTWSLRTSATSKLPDTTWSLRTSATSTRPHTSITTDIETTQHITKKAIESNPPLLETTSDYGDTEASSTVTPSTIEQILNTGPTQLTTQGGEKGEHTATIAASVTVSLAVIIVIIVIVLYLRKRSLSRRDSAGGTGERRTHYDYADHLSSTSTDTVTYANQAFGIDNLQRSQSHTYTCLSGSKMQPTYLLEDSSSPTVRQTETVRPHINIEPPDATTPVYTNYQRPSSEHHYENYTNEKSPIYGNIPTNPPDNDGSRTSRIYINNLAVLQNNN